MRVVSFSLLLLVGCSTATIKWPVEPPPIPQSLPVFQNAVQAVVAPSNREIIIKWAYPYAVNSNLFRYSLKTTTNFVTWVTVTNYPLGYTNDVYVTNDFVPSRFFRMHGIWQ